MPSAAGIRNAAAAVVRASSAQMWSDTNAQLRSDQISASFDNCARSKTCSIVEKGAYDFNQHINAMNAKETRDVEFVVGDAAAVQAFWDSIGVNRSVLGTSSVMADNGARWEESLSDWVQMEQEAAAARAENDYKTYYDKLYYATK